MNEAPKTVSRKKAAIAAVISFIAGLLVMLIALEVVIPWIAAPKASDFGTAPEEIASYTPEWFAYDRAYSPKHAMVKITTNENPARLVPCEDSDTGYSWFYTFYFTEMNGFDFYPEAYEETFFSEGQPASSFTYTADDMIMWWGENKIPANDRTMARGGLPQQNLSGIGIKISGKDSGGEALEFYGYLEFTQEISE